MADALALRNHLIERFERTDAAVNAAVRRGRLTVVVIGGGLVGVELLGELTAFADDILRYYPRLRRPDITKVDLDIEEVQLRRGRPAGAAQEAGTAHRPRARPVP